ncbi:pentapeptide repeat-containing protein [Rhodococcus qingshengii]|uniref:pentapeptide repeat-containing protein n=1 Tax=Rhodococcus qingshengii TaxID=334542 RepID=UPI0037CA489A
MKETGYKIAVLIGIVVFAIGIYIGCMAGITRADGLSQPMATVWASIGVLTSGLLVFLGGYLSRKQTQNHFSATHELEVTRSLRDRFTVITGQLADEAMAVRTGGVYAMEALTDDWIERGELTEAQACINVLCSYLRSPYVTPDGEGLTQTKVLIKMQSTERGNEEHYEYRQDDGEVRRSIVRTMVSHLQTTSGNWSDLEFDFTGATFDRANFSGAQFNCNVVFDLCRFDGAALFVKTVFRKLSSFRNSKFNGTRADFSHAEFFGFADFCEAKFHALTTAFVSSRFWGTGTSFIDSHFNCKVADFQDATFEGWASFLRLKSERGSFHFQDVKFNGDKTIFDGAIFRHGTTVDGLPISVTEFDRSIFSADLTQFSNVEFSSNLNSFQGVQFHSKNTNFAAQFGGDFTSFRGAKFGRGLTKFRKTNFDSSVETSFEEGRFIGGRIRFEGAIFACPKILFEKPETWANVTFDWDSERLDNPEARKPDNVVLPAESELRRQVEAAEEPPEPSGVRRRDLLKFWKWLRVAKLGNSAQSEAGARAERDVEFGDAGGALTANDGL